MHELRMGDSKIVSSRPGRRADRDASRMTTLTRRRLFGLAAARRHGGLAGHFDGGRPRRCGGRPAPEQTSSPPISDLHLLRRATFGPTPTSLRRSRSRAARPGSTTSSNPSTIDDSACDKLIADRFPRVNWTIPQARDGLEPFSWDLMYDVAAATIARAAWSKRQLFEVMVDFWSNHLNVTNPSDRVWDNRHDYDRQVIRKHALGRFEDMLIASATHPAMLLYLNNADSTKDNPNENYGRELLELHTVSVDGGYNEQDMRNSTLIMTGFSVNWETRTLRVHSLCALSRARQQSWDSLDANPDADGYDVGDQVPEVPGQPPVDGAPHRAQALPAVRLGQSRPASLVDRLAKHLPGAGHRHQAGAPPAVPQRGVRRSRSGKKTRRPFEDLAGDAARSWATARCAGDARACRRWSGSPSDLGHAAAGLEPARRVPR